MSEKISVESILKSAMELKNKWDQQGVVGENGINNVLGLVFPAWELKYVTDLEVLALAMRLTEILKGTGIEPVTAEFREGRLMYNYNIPESAVAEEKRAIIASGKPWLLD